MPQATPVRKGGAASKSLYMKPTFHHRLVNSRYEDPCLFVRMLRESRAFLFDAGHIDSLSSGDLLKITDVFVTHMHIDHFIGFDTILRALLRREAPLRVYGPQGITDSVEGKLRGYTWNLIQEYPIKIDVFEIDEDQITRTRFHAVDSFRRTDITAVRFEGAALTAPPLTVKAAPLSHGIPCLGYSLEEDFHININKAALTELNLPVGPWLAQLKRMIRQDADPETKLTVEGRDIRLGDVSHIANVTEGQKISYVTDVSPEPNNVNRVVELVKGSDTLYCEAYFLHEDVERAYERNHLTARIAGDIARRADVRNLALIHFSPKYRDRMEEIEAEAMEAYRKI